MLTQISWYTQTHHIYLCCNHTSSPMQIGLNRWWVCSTHTNKFGYLSRCVHKRTCAHMSKLETVSRRAAVIKVDQNVGKPTQKVTRKQMHGGKKHPIGARGERVTPSGYAVMTGTEGPACSEVGARPHGAVGERDGGGE